MAGKERLTLFQDGKIEQKIKKSVFLCYLKKIKAADDAKEFIQQIKIEHYKAAHHCSAFILGEHMEVQRSSDDGEPSGTAGIPMLEVLKKNNLTNVVAVVVRYFGGVKLGASGLIRAYSGSVAEAITTLGIARIVKKSILQLKIDYAQHTKIQHFLENHPEYTLLQTQFTDIVLLEVSVEESVVPLFSNTLIKLMHAKIEILKVDSRFLEEKVG